MSDPVDEVFARVKNLQSRLRRKKKQKKKGKPIKPEDETGERIYDIFFGEAQASFSRNQARLTKWYFEHDIGKCDAYGRRQLTLAENCKVDGDAFNRHLDEVVYAVRRGNQDLEWMDELRRPLGMLEVYFDFGVCRRKIHNLKKRWRLLLEWPSMNKEARGYVLSLEESVANGDYESAHELKPYVESARLKMPELGLE